MKLFLCTTPLQLFIAHRIIKELDICNKEACFIYIGCNNNKAIKNSITNIENLGFNIKHLQIKKEKQKNHKKYLNSISLHARLLSIFFHKKYNAVYLASIDQKVFYFILSWIKFDNLFTFDDGTANIFPNSPYYRRKETRLKRKVKNYILGIKYDMSKIKTKSQLHYTLYKGYKNIIEKTQHISLTENVKETKNLPVSKKNSCSVILGTVYREAFKKNIDIEHIVTKCINHVREKNNNFYYIPHPRDESNLNIEKQFILLPDTIAEKEIEKLLEKFDSVSIYSFISSCQFNLNSNKRISNSVFFSAGMSSAIKEVINSELLPRNFKIIDIENLK